MLPRYATIIANVTLMLHFSKACQDGAKTGSVYSKVIFTPFLNSRVIAGGFHRSANCCPCSHLGHHELWD